MSKKIRVSHAAALRAVDELRHPLCAARAIARLAKRLVVDLDEDDVAARLVPMKIVAGRAQGDPRRFRRSRSDRK